MHRYIRHSLVGLSLAIFLGLGQARADVRPLDPFQGHAVDYHLYVDGKAWVKGTDLIKGITEPTLRAMIQALIQKTDPSKYTEFSLDEDGWIVYRGHLIRAYFGYEEKGEWKWVSSQDQAQRDRALREGLLERDESAPNFWYDFHSYRGTPLRSALRTNGKVVLTESDANGDLLSALKQVMGTTNALVGLKQGKFTELDLNRRTFQPAFSVPFGSSVEGTPRYVFLPPLVQEFLAQKLVRQSQLCLKRGRKPITTPAANPPSNPTAPPTVPTSPTTPPTTPVRPATTAPKVTPKRPKSTINDLREDPSEPVVPLDK